MEAFVLRDLWEKDFSNATFGYAFCVASSYQSTLLPFLIIIFAASCFSVPAYNVASTRRQAIVIEGVSRNRNDLIDGSIKNYDLESGYTCHQIGSGSITIQLAQPYLISSMRYVTFAMTFRFL